MESTSCSFRPHDTLVSGTSAKANTSEDELVRLSRRVIELLNDRAYEDPWFEQHVSPNVRIDFNGTCIGIGYKDFVGFYRLDADVSPRFCCDVDIMTAMVNENQGTATVILSEVLTGFEDDLMVGKKRAASILWSWKRVKGRMPLPYSKQQRTQDIIQPLVRRSAMAGPSQLDIGILTR